MPDHADTLKTEVSQGQRLARAVLNYGVGGYLPQLINFALVPLYTHYIAPPEMGALEVCLAAQTLMAVLARLGMAGSVTRFYFDFGEGTQLRDMVTTVALTIIAVAAAGLGLALWVGPVLFSRFLPDVPFHPLMDIALAGAFFQAVTDLQRRLLQAREQAGYSARLSVAMGLLGTLTSVAAVAGLKLGAEGVLWSNLFVSVVFAAVAWFRHREDLSGRFDSSALKKALTYGLPLVPHHGAAWLHQFAGRWMLGTMCTVAAVGQLGLATRVASPLAIATGAFGTAFAPIYFSWRTKFSPEAVREHALRVSVVVFLMGAIAVLGAGTFGSFVIRHLMAESYREAALVVPLVATALAMHLFYTLLTNEIFYVGNTKWISAIFICAAGTNILGIWFFGARGQAMAAAGAQIAGGVVSCVLAGWMAQRTTSLAIAPRALAVALVVMVAACAAPQLTPTLTVWLDLGASTVIFMTICLLALFSAGGIAALKSNLREFVDQRGQLKGQGAKVEEAAP